MVNATLFRLPSTELSTLLRGKKIRLPHPCLTLMGVEVAAQFGLTDEQGQPLIPERRYTDKFDPIKFLRFWPFNAEGICDQEVLLPRQVVQLHAAGQTAQDVTDQLSTAARDLLTAIAEYKAKFMAQQRTPDGQTHWVERPSTTTRQEDYKGVWRASIQKTLLNYQFRQLQELRRILKKQVFQTVHPGCFAPLIPDPTLGIDQVRIPAEIWAAFVGQHALVLRHPVLEVVYRMKPVKGSDMAIGLNPLLYDKVGADCVSGTSPIVLRHRDNDHHHSVTTMAGGNTAMATKTIVPTSCSVRMLEELAPTEGIHPQHNLDVLDHNGNWVPCKAVTVMLEQSRQIMQDRWNIPMEVQNYPSEAAGNKTSLGVRRNSLAHLVISGAKRGEKKNLVLWFIQSFHDEQGRKKLPHWLFDEPVRNIQAFLDGWYCGDGDKGQQLAKGSFRFTVENPAHMCYIQLALSGIPAAVWIGNTLSMQMTECFLTPFHHLGLWDYKLARRREQQEERATASTTLPEPAQEAALEPVAAIAAQPAAAPARRHKPRRKTAANAQPDLFEIVL